MIDLIPFAAVAAMLSQSAVILLWVAGGLLFYGCLADQAIFEGQGQVRVRALGPPDLLIGGLLAGLFGLLVVGNWREANRPAALDASLPGAGAMIVEVMASTFVFLAIMIGIMASLSLRGIKWWETFGLNRLHPAAVLWRAFLLLILALPLISVALFISHVLLAAPGNDDASSRQEIVRFLAESRSVWAKGVVALSAIVLAPLQEEFIFRGYIYGVLRRYAGVPAGIVVNAALFAAIHLHAPSFAGLFVLAVCLTLAYEWTGSLLVPMAVHALFNSTSIIELLFTGATGG
jgi:membrane protease YdiL (CAAX protease family)